MDFRSKEECKVGGLVYAGKILEATAAYDCDEIKNAFFSFRNDFLRVFLICVWHSISILDASQCSEQVYVNNFSTEAIANFRP